MKNYNDLTPEQQAAIRNPGTSEDVGGWNMYPRVNAEEAEALRNSKAYRLTNFDLERIGNAAYLNIGLDGNPDTDPLIIKGLAKGLIVENPKYIAEVAAYDAKVADAVAKYGPGKYSFGVGYSSRRWILTDAGREFVRQIKV